MGTIGLLKTVNILAAIICSTALFAMWQRRMMRSFLAVSIFLISELCDNAISIPILYFRKYTGLSIATAYPIYFYSHWFFYLVQTVLTVCVIYSIFRHAMKPMAGLLKMGKVVFRWIACVSLAVSIAIAVGPHMFVGGFAPTAAIATAAGQLEQGASVLMICLLLFVSFATKQLGLTYRSRVFGVSLGFGILTVAELIQSAWFSISQAQSVYSPVYLIGAVGGCVAFGVIGVYFAIPEPERRMITLPTTSPFFFWNRISEVLGDNPGDVVIAGFTPEMMAPAELKVLTAISQAARERERELRDLRDVEAGIALPEAATPLKQLGAGR